MINLIQTIALGGAFGLLGSLIYTDRKIASLMRQVAKDIVEQHERSEQLAHALNCLRRKAYLTDEKGHRRRYAQCSAEVRAQAEGAE